MATMPTTHNRCLQGRAPQYLMNCCHPTSDVAGRQRLRSSSRHHLVVPRHRRSTLGRRAFSIAGPMAWNALPDDLRDPSLSADNFRKRPETHLFRNALGHSAHYRRCVMRCINLRLTYLLTNLLVCVMYEFLLLHIIEFYLPSIFE